MKALACSVKPSAKRSTRAPAGTSALNSPGQRARRLWLCCACGMRWRASRSATLSMQGTSKRRPSSRGP
eukprot:2983810-Prymnesium_polylepis.1